MRIVTLLSPGTGLIRSSWQATAVFTVTAFAAAIGPSWLRWPAVVVALALFAVGIITMLWAFAIAVQRSRVDAIGVGGLYLGMGAHRGRFGDTSLGRWLCRSSWGSSRRRSAPSRHWHSEPWSRSLVSA